MIELIKVVKDYGQIRAVNDLSFTVAQGEVFGLLGPNGAGKSTTIRMMIGLLQPTKGEIRINGCDTVNDKKAVQKEIGVVFESPNLYTRSTIKDNLRLFADLYEVSNERVEQVMEELHLTEKKDIRVDKLSKGWKQRVLIARALLHTPKVLFLDEPTSGLDPNTVRMLHEYIKKIHAQGTTIMLTTHDMHEADQLSTRVGIMNEGHLVAMGTPQDLKAQYGEKMIVVKYREGDNVVLQQLPFGLEKSNKLLAELTNTDKIISIETIEVSLDTVFAKLTGRKLS